MPDKILPQRRCRLRHLGLVITLGGTLSLLPFGTPADTAADPAWDQWEMREEQDLARLRAVNEGELEFLPYSAPSAGVLHTDTTYRIHAASLEDGWVDMHQCQQGLDALERVEILYDYTGLRDLRITRTTGITEAWVEDRSVQMRGVGQAAAICVSAQVQILQRLADGRYKLCSGPYHRRFLDGYFPLQLSLRIDYPAKLLRLTALDPPAQDGLKLHTGETGLRLDAHFVGRLLLHFEFERPG